MDLFSPVTDLRGVGPARAAALQRLGIFTLYDLLAYFPRDYEDRTNPVEIAQLQPGVPACFEALVVSQPVLRRIGKGRDVTNLTVADETGKLTLHYFNQPYIKTQLHYGQSYYFYGTLLEHGMQMANPAFEEVGRPGTVTNRLLPVYPLTAGLSNRTLCACIRQAFSAAGALPELLPETVREQYGLCGVTEAYTSVHAPESWDALQRARKRLVFEEFFIFSAGLAVLRASRTDMHTIPYDTACMDAFFRALPFRLTGAQSGAIDQILRDLSSGHVMNRLVQGDVGSGKTMVAAAACFCAVKNGKQAAFMAPTEILAEQHEKTLSALLGPLGVHVLLLTGAKTPAQKRAAREKIASGEAQLIVGTHALISTGVEFHALGLVVADEHMPRRAGGFARNQGHAVHGGVTKCVQIERGRIRHRFILRNSCVNPQTALIVASRAAAVNRVRRPRSKTMFLEDFRSIPCYRRALYDTIMETVKMETVKRFKGRGRGRRL